MPEAPVRLVIDTDPGIDDAVTLALAARSPAVEVVAVTTTYGNAALRATTRNARTVLALPGRARRPRPPGLRSASGAPAGPGGGDAGSVGCGVRGGHAGPRRDLGPGG